MNARKQRFLKIALKKTKSPSEKQMQITKAKYRSSYPEVNK